MNNRRSQNFKNLNLIYKANYITAPDKKAILHYLSTLYPIWEQRFSKSNPPPEGESNRRLLRPVYWLGNWQFACLDYYHPPKGIQHRCVQGEDYPPFLEKIVHAVEKMVRENFSPKDIPHDWHLNTCLINFYGDRIEKKSKGDDAQTEIQKIDTARVGEHKDFEPGPVASISFGEKALFQFVKSASKQQKSEVVLQQWLEDSSLQVFGGDKFKKQLFHRVQRVEAKGQFFSQLKTPDFETRRINFTFRYVPREHILPFEKFPEHLQNDIRGYVTELAQRSAFWKHELEN